MARHVVLFILTTLAARCHAPSAGAEQGIKNIECVQQGFLSNAHQGDPVDFVYSRHALHHLPDFWQVLALQRIANILRSGGIFYLRDLIFSCEPQEINQVIDTWLGSASTYPD